VPAVARRTGVAVGAVAGGLYGLESLAEYLSPHVTDASVTIGWVIVGGIVAADLVAAVVATARTGLLRAGIGAAVYGAITEYVVWYPCVMVWYYVFHNSSVIDRVWRAEGTYDDFARSGLTDIRVFVLQDYWGAGFFHLAGALVIALLFGLPAAVAGRAGVRRLRRSRIARQSQPGPVRA
jgi:hypothetical protein